MMHQKKAVDIALTLILLLTWSARASTPITHAQQSNRAGLVVGLGDGTFVAQCVTFSESEISGYAVLMRSGLEVTASGGAVCRIEGTGCPADDCFCAVPDYWSYWHLIDGTWQYAGSGAYDSSVGDGDVEGWNWGAEPPPTYLFRQICSPPTIYLPLVLTVGGQREAQN
jgi:hypothetical protein